MKVIIGLVYESRPRQPPPRITVESHNTEAYATLTLDSNLGESSDFCELLLSIHEVEMLRHALGLALQEF